MSNETAIRFWKIFVKGTNADLVEVPFVIGYTGKRIIWEYFFDSIEEDYDLTNVIVTGYDEIEEKEFKEISDEDFNL